MFTYSASKAAVHNLSKNLAREWATKGVRVNVLVPGFFPAEQNRKVLTPERVASIMAKTPMKRFGEAHELVGAALLLASDAGAFITGRNWSWTAGSPPSAGFDPERTWRVQIPDFPSRRFAVGFPAVFSNEGQI